MYIKLNILEKEMMIYDRICNIIDSCETINHIKFCKKLLEMFEKNISESNNLYPILLKERLGRKEVRQ